MNWNCKEIRVTIEGLGTFSVFPEFGVPKTRLIQGIASRIGGMLWINVEADGIHRVPVPNPDGQSMAGNGTTEGYACAAASLIAKCIDTGIPVTVSTAGGPHRSVAIECLSAPVNEDADEGTGDDNTNGPFRSAF